MSRVEVVVGSDAAAVGRAARAFLDAGVRVAVFVGDAEDAAVAGFLAEVVRE